MSTNIPSLLLRKKDEALGALEALGAAYVVEETNPPRPSREGESVWRVVRQSECGGRVKLCVARFLA